MTTNYFTSRIKDEEEIFSTTLKPFHFHHDISRVANTIILLLIIILKKRIL